MEEREALKARTLEAEDLSLKANTDPLTQINNRRAADVWLAERRTSARRCGVIFVDLDHFKQINDTYWHDVGDKVLREVACLMRASLRSDDFVARWGGEEFVVMLSSVTFEEAQSIAENLPLSIAQRSLPGSPDITASLGVVHAQRGADLERAIKRADIAVYDAKRQGRNRVVALAA